MHLKPQLTLFFFVILDGPFTLQANVLKAEVHLEEFLFN